MSVFDSPAGIISPKVQAQAILELRRRQWRAEAAKFRHDICGYAKHILGMDLTLPQRQFLEGSLTHRRVAAKAHHSFGKTIAQAIKANHHYDTNDCSIVYITAPTWHQAKELTYKQTKLMRQERIPVFARGRILDTKIEDSNPVAAERHFIKAINAESAEGFQGEHSAPIWVLIDEGIGVPNYIWEGTEGLLTDEDCGCMAIGNPTDEATPFGVYCSDPRVFVVSGSALEHPNVTAELLGQPRPFPGAVTLLWVYEKLEKECELARPGDPGAFEWYSLSTVKRALEGEPVQVQERPAMAWYKPNAFFQGRVMGQFPGQASENVIPKDWLKECTRQEPDRSELPEVGVDCARHGDDRTCAATRWSSCLYAIKELRQMDLNYVVRNVRETIHEAAALDGYHFDPKSIPCRIDVTGGLGWGPHDTLKAEGYNVIGINSAESAAASEDYPNKRSELWFACREFARLRMLDLSRLPGEMKEKLVLELTTPKWKPTKKNQKEVEPKKDTKKKLGWSPDIADSVNLAFYFGEPPRNLEYIDGSALKLDFKRLPSSRGR